MAQEVLAVEARLKDFISQNLKTIDNNMKKFSNNAKQQGNKAAQAMTPFEKAIKGAKEGMLNFAKTFGPAALAMAVLSKAIFSVGAAIAFVQEKTIAFEKTMSKIKAILNPTAKEFKNLSDRAKELGQNTVFSASQAGQAFVEMGKLGFEANQIIGASEGVLNLAAVAQINMAEAATISIETLNQFELSASQSTEIVDVMAKSFSTSALDINKFKESMKFVGPVANAAGLSLTETTAALGTLANQGVNGSIAGTSLRFMLIELINPSSKVNKLLKANGIEAETFSEKLNAIRELGLPAGEMMSLFGRRAAAASNILIRKTKAMDDYTKVLEDANGTGKRMAATMLDNVAGATIILKSAQEGLAIAIGEAFSDEKQKRIEGYTENVKNATKIISLHKDGLNILSKAYTIFVETLAIKFGNIGKIISFSVSAWNAMVFGFVETALVKFKSLVKGVNVILGAIGLRSINLLELEIAATDKWKGASEKTEKALKAMAAAFNLDKLDDMTKSTVKLVHATDVLGKGIQENSDIIQQVTQEDLDAIVLRVEALKREKEATKDLLETNKQRQDDLKLFIEANRIFQEELILGQQEGAEREKQLFELKLKDELDKFKGNEIAKVEILKAQGLRRERFEEELSKKRIQNALNVASQTISTFQTIGQASKANALVMKRLAQGEAIVNTARAVAQVLPNIPLSLLIGAQGLAQVAIIERQKFAAGGISSGGPATVGEQGPELVVGPRNVDLAPGSRVFNNTETNNIMKPTNNYTLVIPSDSTLSEDRIVETLENLNRDGQLENIKSAFSG